MTDRSHCTALVVDDEPAITELVSCVLESSGMRVFCAHDGLRAFEIVANNTVDVIITDIRMDDMSGFELIANIEQIDNTIKVIVMTSYDSYDMVKRSLKAGAYDYLDKPLDDHAVIIAATQRAFESVRLLRENEDLVNRLTVSNIKITAANKRLLHLNKQLRKLAITDGLTQLFNRRYIDDWIQNHAITNTGTEVSYSVILIDVDYFKQVNDSFGHDGGDEVLRHLATILNNCGREQDLVGRYGGEEFIVVLPGSDESEALRTAERIRSLVERTSVRVNSGAVQITVSMGVSTNLNPVTSLGSGDNKVKQEFVSGRALVAQADKALYAAKDQGRNLCMHYQDLHEQLDDNSIGSDQVTNG
jgi:two-component system cell cycle response regulator